MIEHGTSYFDYRSIREVACNAGTGATAGAIAATFVRPLDVIKTRLQVLGLPEAPAAGHRGSVIITSLHNIVKNEGFRGMYRGLSPTIIALLPNWAVYFSAYGKLKDVLQSSEERGNEKLEQNEGIGVKMWKIERKIIGGKLMTCIKFDQWNLSDSPTFHLLISYFILHTENLH